MTLSDIKNYVYRRTKTNSTSFSAANMLIAVNNAYERLNTIIRKWVDNYRPTLWTSSDLSTGTATPVLDSLFHELIPLWVCYQFAAENALPNVNQFLQELTIKEEEFKNFYGHRNYQVFTITIASPGVITKIEHNLVTNDRISFITTGALPTGLSVDTFYFIIRVDDDTFQVAATKNGTAINTSGTQSGTHYFFSDKMSRMATSRKTQDSNK